MSSRDKILASIKNSMPQEASRLPEINIQETIRYNDLLSQFTAVLKTIGGSVIEFKSKEDVIRFISETSSSQKKEINVFSPTSQLLTELSKMKTEDLEQVERAYIPGNVAVAENSAIWVSESAMGHRLLPFICQHLVLIIEQKQLVATMHEAFLRITEIEGFGSFIAGPSKTADIEQSLVIGAHGPRSLTVYLII